MQHHFHNVSIRDLLVITNGPMKELGAGGGAEMTKKFTFFGIFLICQNLLFKNQESFGTNSLPL